MQSEIYQNFDACGEESTKLKLRDITFQVLKNAVSLVEVSTAVHKILNSQENIAFKQKNAIEQHLITLRNEFLTYSINSNSVITSTLNNFRNSIVTYEDSSTIANSLVDVS
jgi:hypothetical protein